MSELIFRITSAPSSDAAERNLYALSAIKNLVEIITIKHNVRQAFANTYLRCEKQ